ncbi:amidohydrolase family protein [Oceanibium sediminis]|uniref:amidohydrolase family protein n=1 Tax=Oceanibium sediminis TaxID=2026339 RepID=UPI001300AD0E|nr:amidohydrolase family protein [Oceanibium sediminis]
MPSTTLIGCQLLPGDRPEGQDGPFDVVLRDAQIADVRPTGLTPPEGRGIDARDTLVTAGLVNGHHHSHEHFYKGRYDNLPLELWMNYVRPVTPLPLTARDVYLRTLIGAIEAVRTGTTTLVDDLNVSPVLTPEHVEAAVSAYEDIGLRALVGVSMFDRPFFRAVPFVEEEFPPELLERLSQTKSTPPDEVVAYVRGLLKSRHPSTDRVSYLVSPSAPQRCSDEFLVNARALADEFDLPVNIHVHETRLQAVTAQRMYGKTMFQHLASLGFLKPKTSLIHAVWLTPEDIDTIAQSGASVQHNPTSNLKLGSGIAPIRPLLDAGVNVSLGTDGCGSTETLNMMRTVNMAALVNKVADQEPEQWVGAKEAWHAGTVGGATALGRGDDLGRVAPGYTADLTVFRLDSIPFVPANNLLHQLVFAADSAALDRVFVAGEEILAGGHLCKINEAALISEIRERHAEIEPMLKQAEQETDRFKDAYRRIYARCEACAIPPETIPARLSGGAR